MEFASELYYDYLLTALDRACIQELKCVWRLSLTCRNGEYMRSLITDCLPTLRVKYRLPDVDSFAELCVEYKKNKMQRLVNHMPKTWIKYYLEKEDLSALFYVLETEMLDFSAEEDFVDDLCFIAGKQSLPFVQRFLSLEKELQIEIECMFAYVLDAAIVSRNTDVIEYMFTQKEKLTEITYNRILEAAAEAGDWDWITIASEKIRVSGQTLLRAAKGGHTDVIECFMKKMHDPMVLIEGYILGKNNTAAKTILGQYNFNDRTLQNALHRAVEIEDENLLIYLLEKMGNVSDYVWSELIYTAAKHSLDILRCVYDQRSVNRHERWGKNTLISAMCATIDHEKIDSILFLLEKGVTIAKQGNYITDMNRLLAGER